MYILIERINGDVFIYGMDEQHYKKVLENDTSPKTIITQEYFDNNCDISSIVGDFLVVIKGKMLDEQPNFRTRKRKTRRIRKANG